MKSTAFFLSVILFAFTACAQNSNEPVTDESHTNSKTQGEEQVVIRVPKSEFKKYIVDSSNYILVDIRTPQEFNKGSIDGAININYSSPNFKSELDKLDKTVPILMFCQSGGRSGRAMTIFRSLGFKYVLELQGGYGRY